MGSGIQNLECGAQGLGSVGFRDSGVQLEELLELVEVQRCILDVLVVTEAGSYLRLIDSCITQRKAQGPSRTCVASKEE